MGSNLSGPHNSLSCAVASSAVISTAGASARCGAPKIFRRARPAIARAASSLTVGDIAVIVSLFERKKALRQAKECAGARARPSRVHNSREYAGGYCEYISAPLVNSEYLSRYLRLVNQEVQKYLCRDLA
ncbi:hypothetical protein ACU8KH_04972 [Lachancea thermotolerans]